MAAATDRTDSRRLDGADLDEGREERKDEGMKTNGRRTAMSALAVAAVLGAAATTHALSKDVGNQTQCNCTCVAYDSNGQRHEGDTTSFTTDQSDCTIGITVSCHVGDLKGAYAACASKPLPP